MAALRLPMSVRACARSSVRCASALFAAALAAPASAHTPTTVASGTSEFGWTFDSWVIALLALSLAAYLAGFVRLTRRSHLGRRARQTHLMAFAAGWIVLAAVLVSPLDALSAALFSAHMVQHEAMMIVAAPLLVAGRPLGIWIWALPQRARMAIGRVLRTRAWSAAWRALVAPLPAWLLHAVALWAWHAPPLFESALAHSGVHTLQHASFLGTALIFWWSILGEGAVRRGSGHAMLSLFTTMVHTGALGALITLSPGVWYPSYVEPTSALGMEPLGDQQLGGLVMWVPASLAYLIGALIVAGRWLTRAHSALIPLISHAPSAEPIPEPNAASLREPTR
jgi:cytochrome c oxidase assembly factor CtaG